MYKKRLLVKIVIATLFLIQLYKYFTTGFTPRENTNEYTYLFTLSGYLIGYNFFLIAGLIALGLCYRYKKI